MGTKLFDFIKIMFTQHKNYQQVKNLTKKKHHFMINRFFAIKFPVNASAFNTVGINGANVVDSWSLVATRFKGVPGWIYTKTKKSQKDKPRYQPDGRALELYMQRNQIGPREIEEMNLFCPDLLEQDLKKIEEQINVY